MLLVFIGMELMTWQLERYAKMEFHPARPHCSADRVFDLFN
jgi:hypothetical protein